MARKKQQAVTEIFPPDKPTKPTRQTVDAIHTIKYTAPVDVPIPDPETDEIEIDEPEIEEPEIIEDPPSRPMSLRQQLQERLSHVGGNDQLKLRIDRLPFYDANGATGVKADKEFMGVIECTIEFFESDAYLIETARRYGPGQYAFTLRRKNIRGKPSVMIVKSWDERIGSSLQPQLQIDPSENAQHSAYQPPIQQTKSFKQELKEMMETYELFRKLNSDNSPPLPSQPQLSVDEQVAVYAMKQPDLARKAFRNLLGTGGDGDGDTLKTILEFGPPLIKALGDSIREIMADWKNGGLQNGQATLASQALPVDYIPSRGMRHNGAVPEVQAQRQSSAGTQQSDRARPDAATQSQQIQDGNLNAPEDQLLAFVMDQCARQVPVKIACDRIMKMADAINEQSPAQSIDGYLELFISIPPQRAVDYVAASIAGGEQIAAMPHAVQWTTDLQLLLKGYFGNSEEVA